MSHPTLDLKKAYLALRRALESTVKPFGLTAGQFDVLQFLMHEKEIGHRDLQNRLSVSSPTLTNVLDVLERQGHIVRRASKKDARSKAIQMTDAARKICYSKQFCDAGDLLVAEMFDGFSAKEREAFLRYLGRITQNLESIK